MNNLVPVRVIEQRLARATTPAESYELEAVSQVAYAYAKEQKNYEMMVEATHLYIMARRKTTELIDPEIKHGGQGNSTVTLKDYGFTKMQWSRRKAELSVPADEVEAYFDECISKAWLPSLYDLMRHNGKHSPAVVHESWCNTQKGCNCK